MQDAHIVVYCGFNDATHAPLQKGDRHLTLDENWIKTRFELWKKYSWQSILNQTHGNWSYVLRCKDRSQHLIKKYFAEIRDKRFYVVFDKTDQAQKMNKVFYDKYPVMANVRLDSDDMYHPNALKNLYETMKTCDNEWFLWLNGYACAYKRMNEIGSIRRYRPVRSGPFYARRLNRDLWLKDGLRIDIQHHMVRAKNPKILDDNMVLVGIHPDNTSSHWGQKSCFKNKLDGNEIPKVIQEFKLRK